MLKSWLANLVASLQRLLVQKTFRFANLADVFTPMSETLSDYVLSREDLPTQRFTLTEQLRHRERRLPDPSRLCLLADQRNDFLRRAALTQYEHFISGEYQQFLDIVTDSMELAAGRLGKRGIQLSFCHRTAQVTFQRDNKPFTFQLPLGTNLIEYSEESREKVSLIDKVGVETACYFRKNGFNVSIYRSEPTLRKRRWDSSPTTSVTILWFAPSRPTLAQSREPQLIDKSAYLGEALRTSIYSPPSYQTGPLAEYDRIWQGLAGHIFELVQGKISRSRVKAYKGSFSFLSRDSSYTAGKIVIYQIGIGKTNGDWPPLSDGVYILLRADKADLGPKRGGYAFIDFSETIGIAPHHEERFFYFPASTMRIDEAARILEEWLR